MSCSSLPPPDCNISVVSLKFFSLSYFLYVSLFQLNSLYRALLILYHVLPLLIAPFITNIIPINSVSGCCYFTHHAFMSYLFPNSALRLSFGTFMSKIIVDLRSKCTQCHFRAIIALTEIANDIIAVRVQKSLQGLRVSGKFCFLTYVCYGYGLTPTQFRFGSQVSLALRCRPTLSRHLIWSRYMGRNQILCLIGSLLVPRIMIRLIGRIRGLLLYRLFVSQNCILCCGIS